MNCCKEYEELLNAELDGEATPEECARLQAHLAECPACRAYARTLRQLRAGFPELEETELPEGLADGICAAIREEARPTCRRQRWGAVLVPLAACLVLAVGLGRMQANENGATGAGSGEALTVQSYSAAASAADEAARPDNFENAGAGQSAPVSPQMAQGQEDPSASAKMRMEQGPVKEDVGRPVSVTLTAVEAEQLPEALCARLKEQTPSTREDGAAVYLLPGDTLEQIRALYPSAPTEDPDGAGTDADGVLVVLEEATP